MADLFGHEEVVSRDTIRVVSIDRAFEAQGIVVVTLNGPLTDDNIQSLHEYLRGWSAPVKEG